MSADGLVLFNLLVNGLGSFAIAWLLARAALLTFRPEPGRAHVALASLPFVKLAFDLARGIPADSFLWLRARGVPQDLGSFRAGVGLRWFVPQVDLAFSALSRGALYPQSAADLLAAALTKKVAPWAPAAIATALLAVSAALLARRALAWSRASQERRALVRDAALQGRRRLRWRRVSIFVTGSVEGSPFTGGVLAPYVCFPRRVWDALSPAERRAALAHELAHVADHHVLLTTLAGALRDLFWFVPFIGRAERSLREACELAADARAVRTGVAPAVLAAALVRAREILGSPAAPGARRSPPAAAILAATGASLAARVARLLGAGRRARLGFQHPAARVVLTIWVTSAVLLAVAFGNH